MSKKLVQINVTCNGSTGRIMNQIQEVATKKGWEAYSFYGRGKAANNNCIKIGNKIDVLFHVLITRIFDLHGYGSKRATKKMIKKIKEIDPDVIQLHNIHGYYLNMEMLFKYLKTCNKKIVWTLHDCWAFTGHCSYFTYPECEKWKNEGCSKCPRKKEYPASIFICLRKLFGHMTDQLKFLRAGHKEILPTDYTTMAANRIKLFANYDKIRILEYLIYNGESCVSHIVEGTKIPQIKVSQYLKKLSDDDFVKSRRDGRFIYYDITAGVHKTTIGCIHKRYDKVGNEF